MTGDNADRDGDGGTQVGPGLVREHAEVLILGAGGAGYPAAFRLDGAGRKVVMVDPVGNLGGECLAEGCVPSKAVREAALAYARRQHGALRDLTRTFEPGGPASDPSALWQAVLRHKDHVQHLRYRQHTEEIAASGVRLIQGRARILAGDSVEVLPENGPRTLFTFDDLILATGSRPARLPIPGAERALTSHDLFRLGADLPFPARPIVIGGGYVGLESASMLEHLGSRPVVVEVTDQILPGFDPALAAFVARHLATRTEIALGVGVTAIEADGEGVVVRGRRSGDGAEVRFSGDVAILATGRESVLPEGADRLDIDIDRHGRPQVDALLATRRPGVWAPGDVNGRSMLFHSAVRQSLVVAHNVLAGGKGADRMDFASVPVTVFTDPEVASVGLTVDEARTAGLEVVTATYDDATDARAQIFGEAEGFIHLVFEAHSARLVGAQIAGLDSAQLIAPLALALTAGLGARALAESAFPHPMLSEGINKAARQILV